MKNRTITLVPLTEDGRERFIRDNQWAFRYGAAAASVEGKDCMDGEGEVISRRTIERCMDDEKSETYRIRSEGRDVGGVILRIDRETQHNGLEILFTLPGEHGKGIGYAAWQAVEALHPETVVWETCTPYFERRNIHFYVNKCGFQIDQFWCARFQPEHEMPDGEESEPGEGPDEMFHFVKVMKGGI